MTWAILYLISVLIANYTADWFLPFPWKGVLAVGTLVFGLTFTARDHVHRQTGRKDRVYVMIVVTVIMSIIMAYLLEVSYRIIVASAIAIFLSESADTEIYHKLKEQNWILRVLVSNAVSVPLDTIIFCLIAFAGVLPFSIIIQLVYVDIIVKYVTSLSLMYLKVRDVTADNRAMKPTES